MTNPILMRMSVYGMMGALLGVVYFSALGWNVRLYVDAGTRWTGPLVHLGRALVIGAAFTLCARNGALPLLSSVAGFQIIRMVVVNQRKRALERG